MIVIYFQSKYPTLLKNSNITQPHLILERNMQQVQYLDLTNYAKRQEHDKIINKFSQLKSLVQLRYQYEISFTSTTERIQIL